MKKLMMMLLSAVMVMSLAACGGSDSNNSKKDEPIVPETETVEITIDNWQDYFEIVEGTTVRTNEFDEPESVYPTMNLVLKEGIELGVNEYGTVMGYELAVEYGFTSAYYNVEMDLENCTLTIGDLYEGDTPEQDTETNTFFHDMNSFYMSYNSRGQGGVTVAMEIISDVEIIRIQGTITIQK